MKMRKLIFLVFVLYFLGMFTFNAVCMARDPFLDPIKYKELMEKRVGKIKQGVVIPPSEISVKMIVWGGLGKHALLLRSDGTARTVKKGYKVWGFKVKEIKKDQVQLIKESKLYILPLFEE
jgi:hypothetical protein